MKYQTSNARAVLKPRPLLARMAQVERRAKAERVARVVVQVGAVLILAFLFSALVVLA